MAELLGSAPSIERSDARVKEWYVGCSHNSANTGRGFKTSEAEAVAWAEQMREAGWTVWISVSGYVPGYRYPGVGPKEVSP